MPLRISLLMADVLLTGEPTRKRVAGTSFLMRARSVATLCAAT